jgi:hypothetical protein
MFITTRPSALEFWKAPENATIKAFRFIDLGILEHFGAVATVVQNHSTCKRVRM